MRILLVSDLHYTLKQLDWVASIAGEFDLLVVAGDHLDIASIVEPDAQIAVMLEYAVTVAKNTPAFSIRSPPSSSTSHFQGPAREVARKRKQLLHARSVARILTP